MVDATQMQEEVPPPLAHGAKKLAPAPCTSAPNSNEITLADMIFEKLNNHRPERLDDKLFIQHVCDGYASDKLLSLVEQKPHDYQFFTMKDNLIWKKNV